MDNYTRYYKYMWTIKYKCFYLEKYLAYVKLINNIAMGINVILTYGSIIIWGYFPSLSLLFSLIIGINEVAYIVFDRMPVKTYPEKISGLYNELDRTFLLMEKKWFESIKDTCDENEINESLYNFKMDVHKYDETYFAGDSLKEKPKYTSQAEKETDKYFENMIEGERKMENKKDTTKKPGTERRDSSNIPEPSHVPNPPKRPEKVTSNKK